ncbi:MAG: Bax inhibitor-1/YccA family protein [Candidatus Poseidoniaceae archaeon]
MVYRSGNPALNPQYFQGGVASERMTLEGTINKTLTLLGLVSITAMLSYSIIGNNPALGGIMTIGGAVLATILALVILFVRPQSPQVLMSMYAILEGLFIGGFSYMIENYYLGGTEGVVLQALVGTMAVFFTMLGVYKFGLIKPTEKFVLVVSSLVGAIMILYLFNFILMMFGTTVPFLHSSGPIGIGISVVFIVVAALFLIVDFGMIENGVKYGAPKNMEWYGAFGLVLTLVWLYIEMLKLVAKLRDN